MDLCTCLSQRPVCQVNKRPPHLTCLPLLASHCWTSPQLYSPPHRSRIMTSYLRKVFGGPSQPPKSQGESRSRSRPPAVTPSSKSAKSESTPRSGGVKRSHSAIRSHPPSPLRDATNEESLRPPLQRSSSSRSRSKSRSASASSHYQPQTSQYSGPGTGKFHPSSQSGLVLRLV